MGQKALDLAAEEQLALVGEVVVEGLDAEVVPGAEQGLLGLVPDGKGEHAPQLGQHPLAPLLVAVEQDLGVRVVGGEGVARLHQLSAQLHEVVDLAVEHHGQVFILVEHGLGAARQVDDGQPPVAQRHPAAEITALAVRPAVGDGVGHCFQNRFTPGTHAGKANNSTHDVIVLSLIWAE